LSCFAQYPLSFIMSFMLNVTVFTGLKLIVGYSCGTLHISLSYIWNNEEDNWTKSPSKWAAVKFYTRECFLFSFYNTFILSCYIYLIRKNEQSQSYRSTIKNRRHRNACITLL
jgi:hypothetical protein